NAKITSEDATTPAAVALSRPRAASESRNGRNEPATTSQSNAAQNGTITPPRFPVRETDRVSSAGSTSHQPLTNARKTAANSPVQNATASGDVAVTWRSPTRK